MTSIINRKFATLATLETIQSNEQNGAMKHPLGRFLLSRSHLWILGEDKRYSKFIRGW